MKKYIAGLFAIAFILLSFYSITNQAVATDGAIQVAGCLPGYLYSSTTGEPCGSVSFVACAQGEVYSSVTGELCTTVIPVVNPICNRPYNTALHIGSWGAEVVVFQQILKDGGFLYGNVDGHYGYRTERARERYNLVCNNTPTAYSLEFIGVQSTYAPDQTIQFSVQGIDSRENIGTPAKGFHVQAWMQAGTEPVLIDGVHQSFNGTYNYSTSSWDVVMTAPSDDSKTYTIEAAFYCSNPSLGCASSQINKSFNFNLSSTTQPSVEVISPNGGEVWKNGVQKSILWQGDKVSKYDVSLVPYYPACVASSASSCIPNIYHEPYFVAHDVYSSSSNFKGSFSWNVGRALDSSVIPEGKYTIKVCEAGTYYCDYSDQYFEITNDITPSTLSITTPSPLPNGRVGDDSYRVVLNVLPASVPTNQLFWSVSSGNLPPGLILTPSDLGMIIAGKPTTAGTYSFSLKAVSNSLGTSTKQFTLTVEAGTPVPVTNPAITAPVAGAVFNQGQPVLVSWQGTGALSNFGLSYSTSANINDRTLISFANAPAACDANGACSATWVPNVSSSTMKLFVNDKTTGNVASSGQFTVSPTATAPLVITTAATLPSTKVGSDTEITIKATGGNRDIYSWTVSGSLPAGLRGNVNVSDHDYKITGTPTVSGNYNITLNVISNGESAIKTFTLVVAPAVPAPVAACDYPPATTGCTYVKGPNYNATTNCGMVLSCTPVVTAKGTIQGYSVHHVSNADLRPFPAGSVTVKATSKDAYGGTLTTSSANPYNFSLKPGTYTISAERPAGWEWATIAYTMCSTAGCHNGIVTKNSSVQVVVSENSSTDLWWHFGDASAMAAVVQKDSQKASTWGSVKSWFGF